MHGRVLTSSAAGAASAKNIPPRKRIQKCTYRGVKKNRPKMGPPRAEYRICGRFSARRHPLHTKILARECHQGDDAAGWQARQLCTAFERGLPNWCPFSRGEEGRNYGG